MRARIRNNLDTEDVLITEKRYYVNIINPCIRTNSVMAQTLTNLEVWVKDTAVTSGFNDFVDQATNDYGTGTDLCGPKTITIYESD